MVCLREFSLIDYARLAVEQGAKCQRLGCRQPVGIEDIRHYGPHPAGWRVKGYTDQQWVYFECRHCGYQTSLAKLGITRPIPGLRTLQS